MRNILFHPLAEQELIDATVYYEKENQGLGLEYLSEVEHAANLLIRYPNAGSMVRDSVRRLVLPKFPYSLLYRVVDEEMIRVLAVAHHKRKPRYWIGRE